MTKRIRDLGPGDVDALQALLESVPDYAAHITGYPPGPNDAISALITLPRCSMPPTSKRLVYGKKPNSSPSLTFSSAIRIRRSSTWVFLSCTAIVKARAWATNCTTRSWSAPGGDQPSNGCGSGLCRRTPPGQNRSGDALATDQLESRSPIDTTTSPAQSPCGNDRSPRHARRGKSSSRSAVPPAGHPIDDRHMTRLRI